MQTAPKYRLTREMLLDDLAIRCFRDIADQDYVAARLAYHHALSEPSLWQSQQALEKYLKCILLLHRIEAKNVGHSLLKALDKIEASHKLALDLTPKTKDFIDHIETFGADRYLTTSNVALGRNVIQLDRAVWELRRFCSIDQSPRKLKLEMDKRAKRYSLNGWLEEVLKKKGEAHKALVRGNAFWGGRRTTIVKVNPWMSMSNSPLYMHPEILPLAMKYIKIPSELAKAFEDHKTPGLFVPEDGIEV